MHDISFLPWGQPLRLLKAVSLALQTGFEEIKYIERKTPFAW